MLQQLTDIPEWPVCYVVIRAYEFSSPEKKKSCHFAAVTNETLESSVCLDQMQQQNIHFSIYHACKWDVKEAPGQDHLPGFCLFSHLDGPVDEGSGWTLFWCHDLQQGQRGKKKSQFLDGKIISQHKVKEKKQESESQGFTFGHRVVLTK